MSLAKPKAQSIPPLEGFKKFCLDFMCGLDIKRTEFMPFIKNFSTKQGINYDDFSRCL